MAEISTPALRKTVRRFSGGVILASEMLSAAALVRGGIHNAAMAVKHPFDDPFIFQIAGNDPAVMAEACALLSEQAPLGIDINMGCAAPDILKRGIGAMLLTDMKKTEAIVTACRKATKTMLSVKLRSGFDRYDEDYLCEFVTMLDRCGADFITLHPRIAKMGFRRTADWEVIRAVQERTGVRLVGNGDIVSPEQAAERLREYGCRGVMIGREAVKTPWIFSLCKNCFDGTHNLLEINIHEVFNSVLDLIEAYLPEHLHKSRSHRFCQYYCRNVIYWHELFRKIRKESTVAAIKALVDEYFARNMHERIRSYRA